jgi:Fe2+ or Zn2+ uptake regulation protein
MSFKELLNEDLRLAMLRTLEESGGFSMNDSILHAFLDRIGHSHSRDKVRTELHWLADQGLVNVSNVGSIMVATLTERGLDVANARATVPGVKRPSPRG